MELVAAVEVVLLRLLKEWHPYPSQVDALEVEEVDVAVAAVEVVLGQVVFEDSQPYPSHTELVGL